MERTFLIAGALLGALAVGAGAFGAHALKDRVAADLAATYELAVRYQMYHALALLAVGILSTRFPGWTVHLAGWLFLGGTLIFSGTLYVLVLTGLRWLGAITPIGGTALLLGWLLLAWGIALRAPLRPV
jgi:uncharacterized membrane protein YgdD (TMEM256/DUF423 family)